MGVFLRERILSLFVMVLFVVNFVSMTFCFSKETKLISVGVIEQFFSGRSFSSDIITRMLLQKTQGNRQDKNSKETDEKDNTKFQEYVLPAVLTISTTNSNNFIISKICGCILSNFSLEIEYPLKIPFWSCIFLLLILRLLFCVLPRSISVNYNIKNIEWACIV